MKKFIFFILLVSPVSILTAQKIDTTRVVRKDTVNTAKSSTKIKEVFNSGKPFLNFNTPVSSRRVTMPMYGLSDKQTRFGFKIDIDNRLFSDPLKENWTDIRLPANGTNYNLDYYFFRQLNPILPMPVSSDKPEKPLSIFNYNLPSREELDILELLWIKDDVTDTTIYSCLDTTMNITFELLNRLLEKMTDKDLLSRKIVSPRYEFNAFGLLIEMSAKNRRNRIYEYHCRVNRETMKKFVDANAFLFRDDSSIINIKQLRAARDDSTLLRDLDKKIKLHKNNELP